MTNLAQVFLKIRDRDPNQIAIRFRRLTHWTDLTWGQYYQLIEQLAAGLMVLGAKSGDRIAIMSQTRYEWGCLDIAAQSIGVIVVPIYQSSTAEEVEYILQDSGASFFVAENQQILKIWKKLSDRCPAIKKVMCFESDNPQDMSLIHFDSLANLGQQFLEQKPTAVTERAEKIQTMDVATIIYTSGTTGQPKGVVLAHEQIISEISEAFPSCGVTDKDISLTFLPYAHVLGRIEFWGHLYCGFTLAYAESIEKIRQNLLEIRPTIMVAVPRIFEKVYGAIISQVENQKLKKMLFDWAFDVGKRIQSSRATKQLIPLNLLAQNEIAKKFVLSKIPAAFGGRLRFAISGGAPLNADIARFFESAGVLILEGYGLTETTAAITVNTPSNYRMGTVGKPIGDVEIQIAADGEILVRSKKVMREYFQNPAATAEAIQNGWFATGDIGEVLSSGHLVITDRKKDLIKTAGGKYVAPQKIEGLLKLNPFVGNVLIHGDQQKFIVAIISPDKLAIEKYAKDHHIPVLWPKILSEPAIQSVFKDAVANANLGLASWETIKKYKVLDYEFTVEGGELTPSLKVKRKYLDKILKDQIESLYS